MRLLALDASPCGERGNTALVLERLLAGAVEAGATVDRVALYGLRIEPCVACHNCWYRTPGVCVHDDDMSELLDKLAVADIWVFSCPIHVGGMTEGLVRAMERTLPLLSPFFELRNDGRTGHRTSPLNGDRMTMLVSTSGYWEVEAFGSLVAQIEDLSRSHGRRFAGALLRPHGLALKYMHAKGLDVGDVLDAARRAGVELVRDGAFGIDTLRAVSRPLLPQEDFIALMNSAFERRMGCQPGRTPGCA
jgi:multimeric flavodoxin WrbA